MRYKTPIRIAVCVAAALALTWSAGAFQAAKPAASKPAAAKPSPIDDVIEMVKGGLSESLIIKQLQQQNKPLTLTAAQMVKLKQAGVSDNIITVMLDPKANPAPAPAAPAPTPEPAPAAPAAPAPAPVAADAAGVAATPAPVATSPAQKRRVAIYPFDYSAVMTQVQAVFGTQQNIGKGIQAMLVTRVQKDGKVILVDRSRIDEVMKQQDFNSSNRVKQGTGGRVGRILGADAMLTGDIVIFGRDDKSKGVSGGGILPKGFGGIKIGKKEEKAVVAIDYKLIDAESSEIIDAGEARGESVRKSSMVGGLGGLWGRGGGGGEVDMGSSNFAETIIGEATMDCVNKLAEIMNAKVEAMKGKVREAETAVADVSGSTLTLAMGANDGIAVGDVFEILKKLKEVKDPATGEVLDVQTEKEGELTITNVRDKICTGRYSGAPPKVGDIARKKI